MLLPTRISTPQIPQKTTLFPNIHKHAKYVKYRRYFSILFYISIFLCIFALEKTTKCIDMKAKEFRAICPIDFGTVFDAYNYAMAHRFDANPMAVAIPTNMRGMDFLHSLVLNGVRVFAIWSDELDDTASEYVYTTEAGAREAMEQIEANDKEAGVFESNYYKVIDFTKYCA